MLKTVRIFGMKNGKKCKDRDRKTKEMSDRPMKNHMKRVYDMFGLSVDRCMCSLVEVEQIQSIALIPPSKKPPHVRLHQYYVMFIPFYFINLTIILQFHLLHLLQYSFNNHSSSPSSCSSKIAYKL